MGRNPMYKNSFIIESCKLCGAEFYNAMERCSVCGNMFLTGKKVDEKTWQDKKRTLVRVRVKEILKANVDKSI